MVMVPAIYVSMSEPTGMKSSILWSCLMMGAIYIIVGLCGFIAAPGGDVQKNMIDSMR